MTWQSQRAPMEFGHHEAGALRGPKRLSLAPQISQIITPDQGPGRPGHGQTDNGRQQAIGWRARVGLLR
ncbi:hypothetical protein [Thiorhodovibrio frisius]|uniref:Uncharacterized protein n=1 Tax=Thiorhodovibrio frisius TaxID=631362 RepID=H8YVR7_9GAMM|nr:hypothetical protein [Thiorhodovibrio frisius]EIC24007.1 hypothetical protein Thi970DRAFT_00144 [Thiorhodovibrio frisius]